TDDAMNNCSNILGRLRGEPSQPDRRNADPNRPTIPDLYIQSPVLHRSRSAADPQPIHRSLPHRQNSPSSPSIPSSSEAQSSYTAYAKTVWGPLSSSKRPRHEAADRESRDSCSRATLIGAASSRTRDSIRESHDLPSASVNSDRSYSSDFTGMESSRLHEVDEVNRSRSPVERQSDADAYELQHPRLQRLSTDAHVGRPHKASSDNDHRRLQRLSADTHANRPHGASPGNDHTKLQRLSADAHDPRRLQRLSADVHGHRKLQRLSADAHDHRRLQRLSADAHDPRSLQRLSADAHDPRRLQRLSADAHDPRRLQRLSADAHDPRRLQRLSADAHDPRRLQRLSADAHDPRKLQRLSADAYVGRPHGASPDNGHRRLQRQSASPEARSRFKAAANEFKVPDASQLRHEHGAYQPEAKLSRHNMRAGTSAQISTNERRHSNIATTAAAAAAAFNEPRPPRKVQFHETVVHYRDRQLLKSPANNLNQTKQPKSPSVACEGGNMLGPSKILLLPSGHLRYDGAKEPSLEADASKPVSAPKSDWRRALPPPTVVAASWSCPGDHNGPLLLRLDRPDCRPNNFVELFPPFLDAMASQSPGRAENEIELTANRQSAATVSRDLLPFRRKSHR
ncbi:hypothetical protein BOX15_Mlig029128g1, partial [Macrostomum lignano]